MHTVIAALVLTARFYAAGTVPTAERGVATTVASRILHRAGIDISWVDCSGHQPGQPLATNGRCLTPLDPDEVIVRVVEAPANQHRHLAGEPLGDSYVDTAAGTGSLATAYLDSVSALAQAAGVERGTLLGRVIAHEIGHLLLGTATHGSSGLMRAVWSPSLLQRRIGNDWTLSRADAASARAGLLKRARSATDDRALVVPCRLTDDTVVGVTCPSCPVCVRKLPADRMALHLLVEPGL